MLSGMLAFTDKVIDRETANKIREAIKMTKVERMIRKELRKEVKEEVREEVKEEIKEEVREEVKEEVREEIKEEVREEVKEEVKRKREAEQKIVVANMIGEGISSEMIMRIIPAYSYDAVEAIRKEIGQESGMEMV